jgi:phenylpropionate dioxygenase-like ring-hydroxylating dioxygenase large terminal subunit
VYHGWKYDVDGRVLETPSESPQTKLKDRIRHKAYPCVEAAGAIFTYMGASLEPPPFPSFEWLTVPPDHVRVTKFLLECNYLQALEGDCDTAHVAFLHRGNRGDGLASRRAQGWEDSPFGTLNQLTTRVTNTACGLKCSDSRNLPGRKVDVRVSTFAMPCIGSVPVSKVVNGVLDGFQVVYQVPQDDYHTARYNFRFKRSEPMFDEDYLRDRFQVAPPDFRLIANRSNAYLQDRDKQRTRSYSGIDCFATQDAAMTESMGPITDRTEEHLAPTDSYVIALRSFLLKVAKDFQRGVTPPGVALPQPDDYRAATTCTAVLVSRGESWEEAEARLYNLPSSSLSDGNATTRTVRRASVSAG